MADVDGASKPAVREKLTIAAQTEETNALVVGLKDVLKGPVVRKQVKLT